MVEQLKNSMDTEEKFEEVNEDELIGDEEGESLSVNVGEDVDINERVG